MSDVCSAVKRGSSRLALLASGIMTVSSTGERASVWNPGSSGRFWLTDESCVTFSTTGSEESGCCGSGDSTAKNRSESFSLTDTPSFLNPWSSARAPRLPLVASVLGRTGDLTEPLKKHCSVFWLGPLLEAFSELDLLPERALFWFEKAALRAARFKVDVGLRVPGWLFSAGSDLSSTGR